MNESRAETQSRREAAPWPKVRLGEICDVFTGKKDVNQTVATGAYRFFSCSPSPFYSDEYLYDGEAVIVAGNGSYTGRTQFYSGKFDLYQRTYACVAKEADACCVKYVFYAMKAYFEPEIRGGKRGAAIPYIVKSNLTDYKISLPPLPTQRAIAEKLGRYDDLIENNRRRIAILERKAEQLYKEWFVRRRGIGNINGWHKGKLGDVCYLKRGKNITSSEMKPGNIPVIAAGLEPSGYHDNANVHGVSITMSSSGANAGFIGIHYSDIWAADCAYASEGDTPNIYFAYEVLNNLRPVIDNFKMGAAQPHVYPKHINAIKIEIPPESLMAEANNRLATIHCLIANLQKQNALLARERDLLLPRLMNGRVKP